MLKQINQRLVVSCQALEHEPLHSSYIMSKMALAAQEGGAAGIRANSQADIQAIKAEVALPVIGIIKRNYEDSDVFITATKRELNELFESGCDMIAMDATFRKRPSGIQLADLVTYVRKQNPAIQLMADISSVEEARYAEKLGFDCVSTTLYGYTDQTKEQKLYDSNFSFLKHVLHHVSLPVIAEGNIITPEMAQKALILDAHAVVVGGAITRPHQITARFVEQISKQNHTVTAETQR
ncbi:N-acylglucosamine-6-phosphate 2-epimerase [Seinonella peptonophila]|uniref:Putative N-acetylmannosamine-6-phosphate 2-epimerase n=1 Tax=Seinonella peptonophila TaxID=112248 RepID=A0A1M4Z9D4_9BACL|nr:N-acetylmannosamine-6-phosphate 2-epimerase [Seinonella peptonophila]SHF14614.1 N-acylglucosamine-6-phosphate 2-epimerase [Seinonella peptonophila]